MTAERPTFNICVLCASRPGNDATFRAAAQQLGSALAEQAIGLVYGGSSKGVMGTLADSCLAADGYVEGVMHEALFLKESAHAGLSRRFVVQSLHERKTTMLDRCNGLIVLPGGLGTVETVFEIITWAQMGIHAKPLAIWNVAGYYDELLHFLDKGIQQGFIPAEHRRFVAIHNTLEETLDHVMQWKTPTSIAKWLDRDQT